MSMLVTASANHPLDVLLEGVCFKLQLSETQHQTAVEHYEAIGRWLLADGSLVRKYLPEIYPQGSLRLGTTIKPYRGNEFDLDLVCLLQVQNQRPGEVYRLIWDRMYSNELYKPKLEQMPRCVRVNYANDFHLDIVPAVPDFEAANDCIYVPDLKAKLDEEQPENDTWKPSNPKGYSRWFEGKCVRYLKESSARASAEPIPEPEQIHEKPALKRAVQLLKRWRDVHFADRMKLAPPSILVTTLAGHFYGGEPLSTDSVDTIVDQIVDMRKAGRIDCEYNPANGKERICEKWDKDEKALKAFDLGIEGFQKDWKKLLVTTGLAEITAELKRLFGENPVVDVVREFAERTVSRPRAAGALRMEVGTGRVVSSGASSGIAIPSNTFFGIPVDGD